MQLFSFLQHFQLYILLGLIILGYLAFVIWDRRRPKRNALGWKHPDKGGGLDIFWKESENRQPYYIRYDPWSIFSKPIYCWYEDKIQVEKPGQPSQIPEYSCTCGYKGESLKQLTGHLTYWSKHPEAQHKKSEAAIETVPEYDTTYIWKPYEPKGTGATTPNALWDNIDWECAHRFESIKSGIIEAVKLGMGVAMVGICLVAIIMVLDMISKGRTIT